MKEYSFTEIAEEGRKGLGIQVKKMSEGMELEIFLDKPETTYNCGERLKGKVRVTVHEERHCEGLEVILGTQGCAEPKQGGRKFTLLYRDDKVKKPLYQGQWAPGLNTYPFELEVPFGPSTYTGQLIELSWYLKAEARATKGGSVESEVKLNVVPGKESTDEKALEVIHKEVPKGSMGCLLISLALCATGVFATAKLFHSGKDDSLFLGVLLALVGLALILINAYQMLVSKRIGMAETRIASGLVSPTDIIPCSLTFQANMPIEINGVFVMLRCREEAGNVGMRASKKTYQQVIFEKSHELQVPIKKLPAKVPIQARGELMVPAHAASSFTLADSLGRGMKVSWNVEFRIKMKRWPDWVHREEITVRPRRTF